MKRIVAFGEVMARLSPPPGESLGRAPTLLTWYGGAEANAAAAAAQLGANAAMVTTLPGGALGRGARAALEARGVDVAHLRFSDTGRMGLYFASFGAGVQPPEVHYDRAGSAFALNPEPSDMAGALDGAAILHMSGVTPAVSARAAAAALAFAREACARGVRVSFDGNYRGKLWAARGEDGRDVLRDLLSLASIAFIDHRDLALILGESFAGETAAQKNRAAFARALAVFPRLDLVCATDRIVASVDRHDLGAFAQGRDGTFITHPPIALSGIVDRIGAGDAFAGAFLCTITRGSQIDGALRAALYAGAAKHGQRGDMLTISEGDLAALIGASSFDVRR